MNRAFLSFWPASSLVLASLFVPMLLSQTSTAKKLPKSPSKKTDSLQRGKSIYQQKGCDLCHATDGSDGLGPSLKGLFGKKIRLQGGKVVVRNLVYFEQKIRRPNTLVPAHRMPMMPPFRNSISPSDMKDLLLYIRSLSIHKKQPTTKPTTRPTGR